MRCSLAASNPLGSASAASSGGNGVSDRSQGITHRFCHDGRLAGRRSVRTSSSIEDAVYAEKPSRAESAQLEETVAIPFIIVERDQDTSAEAIDGASTRDVTLAPRVALEIRYARVAAMRPRIDNRTQSFRSSFDAKDSFPLPLGRRQRAVCGLPRLRVGDARAR